MLEMHDSVGRRQKVWEERSWTYEAASEQMKLTHIFHWKSWQDSMPCALFVLSGQMVAQDEVLQLTSDSFCR